MTSSIRLDLLHVYLILFFAFSNRFSSALDSEANARRTTKRPTRPTARNPPPSSSCTPCVCGVNGASMSRIVGGHQAKENDYPWMAVVYIQKIRLCGGSLISEHFVLTAAHCVYGKPRTVFEIGLHLYNSSYASSQGTRLKVERIIIHEQYQMQTPYNHDIALLKTETKVESRVYARSGTVCLPLTAQNNISGKLGYVTGWGYTREAGKSEDILREVTVPIWTDKECLQSGINDKEYTANMFCAGLKNGGKDSCQGDSGGPLHIKERNKYKIQIGIVSWGVGCARPNLPGVYTKLANYITWIRRHTRGDCFCSHPN